MSGSVKQAGQKTFNVLLSQSTIAYSMCYLVFLLKTPDFDQQRDVITQESSSRHCLKSDALEHCNFRFGWTFDIIIIMWITK